MKLEYRNNWEHDQYFVNGEKISNLHSVSINGVVYAVTGRDVYVDYNDMGVAHVARSKHYFVTTEVFGFPLEVDLNNIVRHTHVEAIQFS